MTKMSEMSLKAQPRELTGRKVKQLRRQGIVPVVVYGRKQEPAILQVNERDFARMLQAGGSSQLVELVTADGATHNVLVREIQQHPVNHHIIHADFYAVSMTETQEVEVPVISVGEPEALASGLMVLQALDHVLIEALPADTPSHVEVDITALDLDRMITVADLPQLDGVTYLTSEDEPVFNMVTTRVEEEEEEEIEEGEMVEPEVVSRGKEEEEEE
jgi:large subunit ribosomal protein L25